MTQESIQQQRNRLNCIYNCFLNKKDIPMQNFDLLMQLWNAEHQKLSEIEKTH